MAERTKLEAYLFFSFINTLVFCFPAHWVWGNDGWLKVLGMVDIAGAGPVHLVGGVTGLIATLLLKPRHGRFSKDEREEILVMGSPTNALLGMFMLWWGWLGFNCGSTFGISGFKWKLAARSAVATIMSPVGGGTIALLVRSAVSTLFGSMSGGLVALLTSYVFKRRKFEVEYVINGILGGLVAITGHCALAEPWEALIIGSIGAMLTLATTELLSKIKIDDPVGVVGVHAVGGSWSLVSVGIFTRDDKLSGALAINHNQVGLLYGGGFKLLGIQVAGVVSIAAWSAMTSFLLLFILDKTMTIRVPLQREILGADVVEHSIGEIQYDKIKGKILQYRRQGAKGGFVDEVFNRLVESANRDQQGLERLVYMNTLGNKNRARSVIDCFCDHPTTNGVRKCSVRSIAKVNGSCAPGLDTSDIEVRQLVSCELCGRLAIHSHSANGSESDGHILDSGESSNEDALTGFCTDNNDNDNHTPRIKVEANINGFTYQNEGFRNSTVKVQTLNLESRTSDDRILTDNIAHTLHL